MAVLKAGAVAGLGNGWGQADELRHALELTEPKLVIADTPRAQRIEATGLDLQTVTLPIERPLHEALAPILDEGNGDGALPQVKPADAATILFTPGSTRKARGAVSTHHSGTTGTSPTPIGPATCAPIL